MKVRDARAEDLQRVASLHVAAWRAAYPGIIPDEFVEGLDVGEFRSRRESRFNEERNGFVVADETGTIVGFAIFGVCRDADLPQVGQL